MALAFATTILPIPHLTIRLSSSSNSSWSGTSSNDLDNWLVDELRTKGGYWEVEIAVHRHDKHLATLAAPILQRQQRQLEMWPQWRSGPWIICQSAMIIHQPWLIYLHMMISYLSWERWRVHEVRLRRVWFKWAVSAQGGRQNQSLYCYTYLIPYYTVHWFLANQSNSIIVPVCSRPCFFSYHTSNTNVSASCASI